MRRKERIPIILSIMDKKFIREFLKDFKRGEYNINEIIECKWEIALFWNDNPDLRLTQVLSVLNFIPYKPGFWYMVEEVTFSINNGYLKPSEILFWGTYGFEDMDKLTEVIDTHNALMPKIKDYSDEYEFFKSFSSWVENKVKLVYKPINKLNTPHLQNILKTECTEYYKKIIKQELDEREISKN
jgi:hypothetical protein